MLKVERRGSIVMSDKMTRSSLARYGFSLFCVAALTALLWLLRFYFHKAQFGLFYLLAVATVASAWGTRPALLAAFLSFIAWNFFFIPPFYTFVVSDPQDWMMLFVFFVIGALIGKITGRMHEREAEALARERETSLLYKAILAASTQTRLEPLVEQVVTSTGARGCAVFLVSGENGELVQDVSFGDVTALNREENKLLFSRMIGETKTEAAALQSPHETITSAQRSDTTLCLPLFTAERTFGMMLIVPEEGKSLGASDARLMMALAGNVSMFLERQRLFEQASQAAAQHETERLKSILFSSLSHNLKTPLASLTATLSSLQQGDIEWDAKTLQEHFAFMAEDAGRLTEYIENLLNLAQLESENWAPKKEWVELQEVVSMALRRLPESDYRRVQGQIPDDFPLVYVDSVQMSQVLRHLVENALNYSPPASTVRIGARAENEIAEFWVDDEGPGIPSFERGHVFRKFYRGQSATKNSVRGTGLGLAICQEIIQSHQGNIQVKTSPSGGARLYVRVPLMKEKMRSENNDAGIISAHSHRG